jgi:hypothetical protein
MKEDFSRDKADIWSKKADILKGFCPFARDCPFRFPQVLLTLTHFGRVKEGKCDTRG